MAPPQESIQSKVKVVNQYLHALKIAWRERQIVFRRNKHYYTLPSHLIQQTVYIIKQSCLVVGCEIERTGGNFALKESVEQRLKTVMSIRDERGNLTNPNKITLISTKNLVSVFIFIVTSIHWGVSPVYCLPQFRLISN